MPEKKSVSATLFCKVCFKEITRPTLLNLLGIDFPLCEDCFAKMGISTFKTKIGGVKAFSFYEYNETIRTMLYQLKGCFDFELAPIFLAKQASFLRFRYSGYYLVPAPSFEEKNEIRGFNHVVEIFRPLGLPYVFAIRKIDNVKQADLSAKKRREIGKHLEYVKGTNIKGKKILFVDDLMTTGATARACVKLLEAHHPAKIRVLTMAHTLDRAIYHKKPRAP